MKILRMPQLCRWQPALLATSFLIPGLLSAQPLVRVPGDSPTIQTAITAVDDGGIIELAPGTYNAPAGGFTVLDLAKGFTLRAADGAAVTLSGGNSTDILRFASSPGRATRLITFERLKFANGLSKTNFIGGALTIVRNNAVFTSCDFENNSASPALTGGGAIWFESASASFAKCTWTNNTSKNYGAAMAVVTSNIFVRDCSFIRNRVNLPGHAPNAPGGAIFSSDSSVSVDNSRFEDNHAGYTGGAIYSAGTWKEPVSTPAGRLVVRNSLFTRNSAVKDPSVTFAALAVGGAIHIEDQVTSEFYNCRFEDNFALQGGAFSSYRGLATMEGCVFQRNHADGSNPNEATGGSIYAISDDVVDSSTGNGTIRRRPVSLVITDSLFQGTPGNKAAMNSGAIFIAGNSNAAFGLAGVHQSGSVEDNRAKLVLTGVAFLDLSVVGTAALPGTGGAIGGALTRMTMTDSMAANCYASHYGGVVQLLRASAATIQNSTFAHNEATQLGGVLFMIGGDLNISGTNFAENQTLTYPAGLFGSALVTGADNTAPFASDMTGRVENCVFNDNGGSEAIYDAGYYLPQQPVNRLQYNNNTFYQPTGVLYSDLGGGRTLSELNVLTLNGVVKSSGGNVELPKPAQLGAVLMLPPTVLQSGAPGETLPIASHAVFTSSGATAVLNGASQTSDSGAADVLVDGANSLKVGSSVYSTVPLPGATVNISTRLPVGGGDNVLIAGMIITGQSPKRVLIRGVGPSLAARGVAGVLQDPVLRLVDSTGATLATNDNWRSTQIGGVLSGDQSIEILASGAAPSSGAESAIITTLNPGSYTTVVSGANGGTGVGLVEVYDLDSSSAASTLANISTRGSVQTGDDVMIGGFIYAGGSGATNVVIRGIGPSLQKAVSNALSDPVLELFDSNGTRIGVNDNWQDSQQAAIQRTGLAPQDAHEAAILLSNPSRGAYTAVLRDSKSVSGVGLIEVYVF